MALNMDKPKYSHIFTSLNTRITILLSIVLFIVFSLFTFWDIQRQTKAVNNERIADTKELAAAILDGSNILMEHGDAALIHKWLKIINKNQMIKKISILRRDGSIAYRDNNIIDKVNLYLGYNRAYAYSLPTVYANKKDQAIARQVVKKKHTITLITPGQIQLFSPIFSKPACAKCHGYDPNPVLGVFDIKILALNTKARIEKIRTTMLKSFAFISILIGLLLWLGLNRLVLKPIAKLSHALKQAGSGNYSYRLPKIGQNEFSEIASKFNAMQKTIQSRNAMIYAAVKYMPNAMILTDSKGIIRSFNPASEWMFGYNEAEAIGQNVNILIPEPYKSEHDKYLRRYMQTGKSHIIGKPGRELEGEKKDGSTFQIELMVSEIPLDEKLFLGIIQDITIKKQNEAKILHMTLNDDLTNLPNRRSLLALINNSIADNIPFALFYLDLNRFTTVNEVLGYSTGNQVLIETGKRLSSLNKGKMVTARVGGDNFAVFWPYIYKSGDTYNIANELIDCMRKPLQLEQCKVDIDVSIGIISFISQTKSIKNGEKLLDNAEIAMNEAKRMQRNFAFYDTKMQRNRIEHLALKSELYNAIKADELLLYYQPKVDINHCRIVGVEALVRWQHPEKGLMRPDLFIPMVEKTDLIHPLTNWVINEGARQASLWYENGINLITSVNLTAGNLSEADLADRIEKIISHYNLPPDRLMLEITETGIMADRKQAQNTLETIHSMGIGLSIDDFGTGYSSLSYLKDLPVDELKVDLSFVRTMLHNKSNETIVNSTIQLAHNLGLTVTAEGVENEKIWQVLAAMKCDKAQGYYMGKPMPLAEFEQWLKHSPWGIKADKTNL